MHTEMFTVTTEPDGQSRLLYSAESWVRLRLAVETDGLVAVSTREDLAPLASGKGVTISEERALEVVLPRGDRLFVVADTDERLAVIVEPIPWLAQIADILEAGFAALASASRTDNR